MKRSIYFTLAAMTVVMLCSASLYFCQNPVINLIATLIFCVAFVMFLIGCALIWSYWTKKVFSNEVDTYGGLFFLLVACIALMALLLFPNVYGMIVTIIPGYIGIILVIAGEIKRNWKNNRKMTKPTKSGTVSKTPEFTIVHKPRKVSQAEFKRIILFCKENNLGHLTVSQAIIAWDDYCEFVTL